MNRGTVALGLGLLLGLGAVVLGPRITRGTSIPKDWERQLKAEEKEPWPPAPSASLPSDRQRRAESIIQTVKEMCQMLRSPHIAAHEFAERFGTLMDSGEERPSSIYFLSHNPWLRDSKSPDTPAEVDGDKHPACVSGVRIPVYEDTLTLADLELAFGPARVLLGPSDDIEFDWEPPADGSIHCRIQAGLASGQIVYQDVDRSFRKADGHAFGRLRPELRRENVYISDFWLRRGTMDEDGEIWPESFNPPPSLRAPLPPARSRQAGR